MALCAPVLPLLPGCRESLRPLVATHSTQAALSLLKTSADAHGLSHLDAIHDLNVSYQGHWRWLVGKIQPELVDSGFRGQSQERWILHGGIIAQLHSGPAGQKKVVRVHAPDGKQSVQVWFNGQEATDRSHLDAAALVVDAYSLFLLGPMLLADNLSPRRELTLEIAGPAKLKQEKGVYDCDVLHVRMRPGIGRSESDLLAMWIDRVTHLMLRVRMSLNGLESTQGALVDVDTFAHRPLNGILWPTRFHERLLRPAPLDVHEWRMTGLDFNRGESHEEIVGPAFRGRASPVAESLRSGES